MRFRLVCGPFLCIGILTLSACTSSRPVQVVDLKARMSGGVVPATHVVRAGETLYSIAWRYDRDYREIAALNGIDGTFRIYPGQQLRLQGKPLAVPPPPPHVPPEKAPVVVRQPAVLPSAEPSRSNPDPGVKKMAPVSVSDKLEWRWPVEGGIRAGFSSQPLGNKGIDISGKRGEPVNAAAGGVVVYSGTGLVGYGKLIIIKHNDKFLSAYAHNEQLLVKEGAKVKVGQKIAELGSSGTDREMLHFEIRRDGKPVDPLQYLPQR